jgi:hypothetical protein
MQAFTFRTPQYNATVSWNKGYDSALRSLSLVLVFLGSLLVRICLQTGYRICILSHSEFESGCMSEGTDKIQAYPFAKNQKNTFLITLLHGAE